MLRGGCRSGLVCLAVFGRMSSPERRNQTRGVTGRTPFRGNGMVEWALGCVSLHLCRVCHVQHGPHCVAHSGGALGWLPHLLSSDSFPRGENTLLCLPVIGSSLWSVLRGTWSPPGAAYMRGEPSQHTWPWRAGVLWRMQYGLISCAVNLGSELSQFLIYFMLRLP